MSETCKNPDFHILNKSGEVIGEREESFCVIGKGPHSKKYMPLHHDATLDGAKKYIRDHSQGEANWQYDIKDKEGRVV